MFDKDELDENGNVKKTIIIHDHAHNGGLINLEIALIAIAIIIVAIILCD